jgi:hypothetical protein
VSPRSEPPRAISASSAQAATTSSPSLGPPEAEDRAAAAVKPALSEVKKGEGAGRGAA